MYGRERPPTPLRTPGLLAPEAVTKTSCPPDALRASRGAPVSWSVSGGCPSTQVRRGSSSFVEVRSFFVVAVVLFVLLLLLYICVYVCVAAVRFRGLQGARSAAAAHGANLGA